MAQKGKIADPHAEREAANYDKPVPSREYLFASQDPIGNNGILGNPNLEPETTIQYSAGIKHQFTDFIAGQFSLYSKDIYDLIASTQVTDEATGQTLARQINKAYASARGIEVSLEKRYSDNYQFNLAYTYAFADGVASDSQFGANPEGLEFLPIGSVLMVLCLFSSFLISFGIVALNSIVWCSWIIQENTNSISGKNP